MIKQTDHIQTFDDKKIPLKQKLYCSNFGIYGAQCKICKHIYIGQTKNKFSTRWSGHRSFWNNICKEKRITENNDNAALFSHYQTEHEEILNTDKNFANCYDVIFLEQPNSPHNLDFLESKWISKLNAQINISKTILPKFK